MKQFLFPYPNFVTKLIINLHLIALWKSRLTKSRCSRHDIRSCNSLRCSCSLEPHLSFQVHQLSDQIHQFVSQSQMVSAHCNKRNFKENSTRELFSIWKLEPFNLRFSLKLPAIVGRKVRVEQCHCNDSKEQDKDKNAKSHTHNLVALWTVDEVVVNLPAVEYSM